MSFTSGQSLELSKNTQSNLTKGSRKPTACKTAEMFVNIHFSNIHYPILRCLLPPIASLSYCTARFLPLLWYLLFLTHVIQGEGIN